MNFRTFKLIILITLLLITTVINAQTIIWEETFDPNPTDWTLEGNWSFEEDYLIFNWSPMEIDYDFSAISPIITVPDINNGVLVVTQYFQDFTGYNGEMLEIKIIHEDEEIEVWSYNTVNGDWGISSGTELEYSLAPYAGEYIQLKFRSHGGASFNMVNWKIFNIAIQEEIENDLEALSIQGDIITQINTQVDYIVFIRNNGTVTQDDYSVRLIEGDNTELYLIDGTEIYPGEEAMFVFPHTFLNPGITSLRAEVVFDEDDLPGNNETFSLNIAVLSHDSLFIQIGEGNNTTNLMPVSFNWRNSINQTVYLTDEFDNNNGVIAALEYYNSFPFGSSLTDQPLKIWMGQTTQDMVPPGYFPYDIFTLVFDSTVDFPALDNTITIPLEVPYTYGQGNLVVMTNRPMDTELYWGIDQFYFTNTGPNRTRRNAANSEQWNYNPEDLPIGNAHAMIPNTGFYFLTTAPITDDLTALELSGEIYPIVGDPSDFIVAVKNLGSETQDNFEIRLMDTEGMELVSEEVNVSLEQNEEAYITVTWVPDVTGERTIFAEVVLDGDQNEGNNVTSTISVVVQPAGTFANIIGTDSTSDNTIPFNFLYKNSIAQTIYMSEEINVGGSIIGISYYNNFSTELLDYPVKIWITETDQSDLSDGWMDYEDFTQVFHGNVDFPAGENSVHIQFQQSFTYTGGNLVVMTNRVWDDEFHGSEDHFYYTETSQFPNRSRYLQSNDTEIDPENIFADGMLNDRIPNTTIFFAQGGIGTLTGTVTDIDDEPLYEVDILVQGTNFSTQTDTDGYYSFLHLPEGIYTIVAEKTGFQNYLSDDILITEDEITTYDFTMLSLSHVTVSGLVVGSDFPDIGIANAEVYLTGYIDYETITDADGYFLIADVFVDQTYDLTVIAESYSVYNEEVYVGFDDLDLGSVIVEEIAYPPATVLATQNPDDTEVELIWGPPTTVDSYFYDFEDNNGGWTGHGIGTGGNLWEWGEPAQTIINNAYSGDNVWMTGLDSDYENNANTWLMSPELDFSNLSEPYFSVWINLYTENNFDAMVLEASTDDGDNWQRLGVDDPSFYNNTTFFGPLDPPKWSGQLGDWQEFSTTFPELGNESSVYLRFRFQSDNSVTDEGIAIDNVYIGPEPLSLAELREERNRTERLLEEYRVFRFNADEIDSMDNWVELADVTDTTYTDTNWDTVDSGFYYYAVKGVYTNEVLSDPAISNWLGKNMTTNVTVNVTTDVGDSAENAEVALSYLEEDPEGNSPVYIGYADSSDPAVVEFFDILIGSYDIEVNLPGYYTYNLDNINIDDTTVLEVELEEIPYPPSNLHFTAGINHVNLMWDPPIVDTRNTEIDAEIHYIEKMLMLEKISKEEAQYLIENIIKDNRNSDLITLRTSREFLGYNVYRDGVQINTNLINSLSYTDEDVENNLEYVYFVTAQYTLSESEPSNIVTVTPGPQQLVQVGTDTTTANTLPFNFYWRNSLSQTIYMQSELNAAGLITEIQYFNNFNEDLLGYPVIIWMGETDQTDLTDGWISAGELELVFEGIIDFPENDNTISITLDEHFLYTGSDNLVIMANRPMDAEWHSSLNHFYYTATDYDNRSRNQHSDGNEFDPYDPDGGTLTNRVPNTGFSILTSGMGNLNGIVENEDGEPVEGATVAILDTSFETTTDSTGYYYFEFVSEGTQQVLTSSHGYFDLVQETEIIENQTVTLDFLLESLPMVTVTGTVVGSDLPEIGLEGALVTLDGYSYYEATTNADGDFMIDNVYGEQEYELTIDYSGYDLYHDIIYVGDTNENLGNVIIYEIAFPPSNVVAELNLETAEVELIWESPSTTGDYYFSDFEIDDTGVSKELLLKPEKRSSSPVRSVEQSDDSIYKQISREEFFSSITPTIGADAERVNRALEMYAVFRLAAGQEDDPDLWDDIGTVIIPDTIFVDTNFSELPSGHYKYAVRSVYTNNVISDPAFSNTVEHDMYAQVTMTITTNSGDNPTGATITLTNQNENPNLVYTMNSPPSGLVIFPQVWKGIYNVSVVLQGFETYESEGFEVFEPTESYLLELIEDLLPVVNLSYEIEENNVMLEWSEPWSSTTRAIVAFKQTDRSAQSNLRSENDILKFQANNKLDSSRVLQNYIVYRDDDVIADNVIDLYYDDQGLENGVYIYGVQAVYTTGESEIIYTDEIEIDTSVAVDESLVAAKTELRNNYPNPFNPDTVINFSIREDAKVAIEIYNVRGQKIKTLVDDYLVAGHHSIVWNGKTSSGSDASSGIFFYMMRSGTYSSTKKMILLK